MISVGTIPPIGVARLRFSVSEGGGISRFRDFGHAHLPYLDRVFELQYLNTENCRPKKKKDFGKGFYLLECLRAGDFGLIEG